MKTIILRNWTSPDMRGMSSYATSYTLRSDNSDLFTVHLNRQLSFYQISEFISAAPGDNFTIEQTNRVGTPKIAAFDKESGNMLGVFQGNTLMDVSEAPIFHLTTIHTLNADRTFPLHDFNPEDYAGVLHEQKKIAAIFSHRGTGWLARMRRWLQRFTNAPMDVLEVKLIEEGICDLRMICAVAVILHNRGGLNLK